MTENWRPVPGFTGYEASDLGRIRSVDRTLTDGRLAGGVILKPAQDDSGYLRVTVRRDGQPVKAAVHVLVALAFKGPRPRGKQVRHLNGRQADNRPGNLAWGSKSKNELDKGRHRKRKVSHTIATLLRRV